MHSASKTPAQRAEDRPIPTGWLIFTAGLCGALVMVIEVLGSRAIGPFFGVSLFVWTSLIAVTLLSLAAGYALGGYWADRHPSPRWLYGIIIAAGLLTALIPWLKHGIIEATMPLGLRAGALVSSTLLFGPALLLLGCVSPYVVRLATRDIGRLGRTVGVLYAVSTAGSFAGTALTGFYVIAYIGVSKAFLLCGGLLCLIGIVHFMFFERRFLPALAILPFLLTPGPLESTSTLPDGTQAILVESDDSFYGSVTVVDYKGPIAGIRSHRGSIPNVREMKINGLVQGGIDVTTGESVYEYSYLLQHLPLAAKPDTRSTLLVGLGAGIVGQWYADRGIAVDTVEIDPLVVAMAERHFGLNLPSPVVVEDARYFIAQPGKRYDVVLLDAFTGDSSPSHLLSSEALASVKKRMVADGVLALNIIGEVDNESQFLPAVVRTLKLHFSDVVAFPMFDLADPANQGGNIILLARNGDLTPTLATHIDKVHQLAANGVALAIRQSRPVSAGSGLVLTDDYNPLDLLDIEMHENIRRTILRSTPTHVLLFG